MLIVERQSNRLVEAICGGRNS